MMRKNFEPAFKAKVALEALRAEKTIAQISSEYGVHSTQIGQWKQELVQRSAELFSKSDHQAAKQQQEQADKLHRVIGKLTVENDWLKKKLDFLV